MGAASPTKPTIYKYIIIVDDFPSGNGTIRPNWCKENIGIMGVRWQHSPIGYQTVPGKVVYGFKREADAMFFALKWAGNQ